MSKVKRITEDAKEKDSVQTKSVQVKEPNKATYVLVKPEFYQQVFNYLLNSVPKSNSVNEVITLMENLRNTSKQTEITFND